MNEPRILHLETATNICSVALSKGKKLLAIRETDEDRSHGAVLTVFMQEVLEESKLKATDIDAISVSKGPGSYTGLRIGVSVTKGFAYAHNISVIGISTLRVLCVAALDDIRLKDIQKDHNKISLCPLLDARRMEVYTAAFTEKGKKIEEVSAKIIDEHSFENLLEKGSVVFFGNGSDKIKDTIKHENAHFINGITPSAKHMIPLALQSYNKKQFEDTAYFEPFYLKDFVATIPKKKIF
jgi:tRNA threonylcarbamoyladenosine biosynthesis protein TsaB